MEAVIKPRMPDVRDSLNGQAKLKAEMEQFLKDTPPTATRDPLPSASNSVSEQVLGTSEDQTVIVPSTSAHMNLLTDDRAVAQVETGSGIEPPGIQASSAAMYGEREAEQQRDFDEACRKAQQAFVTQQAALEQREQDVQKRERHLDRREQTLNDQAEDLQFDQERLAKLRQQLEDRIAQASPERVRALELEVKMLTDTSAVDRGIIEQLQAEHLKQHSVMMAAGGLSPEVLIAERDRAHESMRELRDQLATYPSLDDLASLRAQANESERLRKRNHDLQLLYQEASERASRLELHNREAEQLKVQADALRVLNDELKKELGQHKEALESRSGARFPALLQIDGSEDAPPRSDAKQWSGQLKSLVSHVKAYAAQRSVPLFYSDTTIRAFIASLATSRLLILQGLSGTGKTSLPRVFLEAIGGHFESIPVQAGWRDRHELLGYYNDFSKKFTESEFTKAVYRAGRPRQQDVVWAIVLDEMNLARIEYYFADFLSILEEPDRQRWLVSLMNSDPGLPGEQRPMHLDDGYRLRIPENLWFVGTANRDESTFEITDKVYDRAQIIEFNQRHTEFAAGQRVEHIIVTRRSLQDTFEKAKRSSGRLDANDYNYIDGLDTLLQTQFGITFGNRIKRQLESFVPVFVDAGGGKDEAVDFQLAHKVLRKLEGRHDHNLISKLKELTKDLDENKPSGWGKLSISHRVIQNTIERMGG